jgi:hypothetical protein
MNALLDRQVTHSFRLQFRDPLSAADTLAAWRETVRKLAPFAYQELGPVLNEGRLSRDFDNRKLLEGWRTRVQSVAGDWEPLRDALRDQIVGWR